MAEPEIEQPVAPGNTDIQPGQADVVPPPPQGASDTPPENVPPPPAGATDTPPSTENGQDIGPSPASALASTVGNVLEGAGKGLHKTLAPGPKTAAAIKNLTGLALTPENKIDDPHGLAQQIGYGGETLLEFLAPEAALGKLSVAEHMLQTSKVAKVLEQYPRLMKAVQLGIEAAGAQGIQTFARTGNPKEAATQAAETGASAGVLGGAFSTLGRVAEKAGEAGKAVEEASAVGKAAPTAKDIGEGVKNQIDTAEQQMHGDFETGIQKLKGDLGDQKVPYQGSPLQKAAKEALQGKTDAKGVLGGAFQSIAGGSDESKKFLNLLNDPKSAGDMGIDELVQYRQQLGEKIGTIVKGSTNSAERADVGVYQKLRDGIDDTIDSLAKSSGKPEASQDYEALRAAYKDRVKLFNTPVIRELSAPGVASETKLDSVKNYLLKGGNKIDKVNTLGSVLGDDGLKELGKNLTARAFTDASSESGQINPAKFVKNFKEIDNLPPEVKEKLFDMNAVDDGLQKLSSGLKSAANYQKLVRGGVLSAASAATGAAGGAIHAGGEIGAIPIALGLLGEKGTDFLDKLANRPGMWKAFRKAGEIGATLEPAARKATPALGYGAGNALSNIVSGASQPLSQPDEDQQVVYTNQ